MNSTTLLFDIGGTWIKSVAADSPDTIPNVAKAPSPLHADGTADELADILIALGEEQARKPAAIAISTAGVVNDHGNALTLCAPHLAPLRNPAWLERLRTHFRCPVTLINDADCALIGAVENGLVSGPGTLGLMVIGTGLGFCVWRNGRRWRPGRSYTLLGAVTVGDLTLDHVVSASRLAAHSPENDLCDVLRAPGFADTRETYFRRLAGVIESATTLYQLDEVAISGGLVNAAQAAGLDLTDALAPHLLAPPITVRIFEDGNRLQLLGALALAKAEAAAEPARFRKSFAGLRTEQAHDPSLRLHEMTSPQLTRTLLQAELEAAEALLAQSDAIAETADAIAERLRDGGRLIYVGCGSSGRIAALDAVEIPCTFGLAADRVLTLIAGGVTQAAMDVEHNFEEDSSAVPEMLLLNVQPRDVVLGISASGSAYYVRSALAMARSRGALSILLSVEQPAGDFFDRHLTLGSGGEVLTGSTRMKAGTATKKILNALTTTAMIRLGKVRGTNMIDLACVNEKLVARAQGVLAELFGCDETEALRHLQAHDFQLLETIQSLES